MRCYAALLFVVLVLTGCGAAQVPDVPAISVADATRAARRASTDPYPTATDTPVVSPTGQPGAAVTPSPQATKAPGIPTPAASTTATATPYAPAGFSCDDQSGGQAQRATITAVRLGTQGAVDRFVVEFDKVVPRYRVTHKDTAQFVENASGQAVTLQGTAGILIDLRPASSQGGYHGPTDLRLQQGSALLQARQVGDFEAVSDWALGLRIPDCFKAYTLENPPRLVVDVPVPKT